MSADKLSHTWGPVLLRKPGFQDKKQDNLGCKALLVILKEFQAIWPSMKIWLDPDECEAT